MKSPYGHQHVAFTSQMQIHEICLPLFKKLNLNYFHHARVYTDGSMFELFSRTDWHEYYYEKNYRPQIVLPDNTIEFERYRFTLWRGNRREDLVHDARNLFNIDHALSLTIAHKDRLESYAFAADVGNEQTVNTYFENMKTLINFTRLFQEQAKKIILLGEKAKVAFPKALQPLEIELLKNGKNPHIQCLYNTKTIMLTPKEFEIIRLLSQGLTIKKIAHLVCRSPRTVETHVNQVKLKFGVTTQLQLLELLRWSDLI